MLRLYLRYMPEPLKKEKENPQSHAKCKHCKYEIGCFGGSGLAERHSEEYRDYSSIFKPIHKNLFPLRDKNPILKFGI